MFDKDKALKWLDEKWPQNNRKCDICGTSKWTLAEDVITPMLYKAKGITIGGNSYPQFMVVCNNCGNTRYFNSIIPGVIQGDQKNGK